VLACLPLGAAVAGDFDGSRQLICAPVEALDCASGEGCEKGLPADFGAPSFMRIDVAKKTVAGQLRTTAIVTVEKNDKQLLLQGTELDFGWTIVVDQADGAMAATLTNRTGAYVLFGSCMAL